MKQIILFSIGLLILISCKSEDPKPQIIRISFSNGKIFCQGKHIYSSDKKDTVRTGSWNFYYPNGQKEISSEYNEDGEIIRYKSYSFEGILIESYTKKDELESYSTYYDSGSIKIESIIQTKSIGEDETEEKAFVKEYYPNNKIYQEYQQIDGIRDGITKIWDAEGNLVLSVKYVNGIIHK
ncbi:MAG: hypothetical protein CVV23_05270 [Ignavibacteriae bacterium HGW-Ignavibacteriae-2]|jgi:antitoxin component YwqK of YwqJK toxin-antitoxin module|nr:MAG: hypothetical protein CVV23_05270 [Ignavibacteriae bacterium HGW-Ignavibacteriae-2]